MRPSLSRYSVLPRKGESEQERKMADWLTPLGRSLRELGVGIAAVAELDAPKSVDDNCLTMRVTNLVDELAGDGNISIDMASLKLPIHAVPPSAPKPAGAQCVFPLSCCSERRLTAWALHDCACPSRGRWAYPFLQSPACAALFPPPFLQLPLFPFGFVRSRRLSCGQQRRAPPSCISEFGLY
jgi:hypothetical protein